MKRIIVLIFLFFFLSGCQRPAYRGVVKVFDSNGVFCGLYEVETTRQMQLSIESKDVSINSDSRTRPLFDSLSLGFERTVNKGTSIYDPYY